MMNSDTDIKTPAAQSPVFAIVVGEHSGDTLGAGLMTALLKRFPNAKFIGIGGPKMLALGFESLFDMEELSVMGIFEVLGRLKRLFHVKDSLVDHFSANNPDVFIGIDAPDFNLRLEQQLKEQGIKTVHYVSPSVWAWRQKRIFKIAKATNMVLSLLPFEKNFYDQHNVPCTFVGHPLADDIPLTSDKALARSELSLPEKSKILALMPGSRGGELSRLVAPFLQTAQQLLIQDDSLIFVAPLISEKRAAQFNQLKNDIAPDLPVQVIINNTQQVMAASDCLLTASGTVTLEAALIKRPMIICYKFNFVTFIIAKLMVKLEWFSLPNLLANKTLVPELLQQDVCVENILPLVKERLYKDQSELNQAFMTIHQSLQQNASEKSAEAVINLLPDNFSHVISTVNE
ncbi:lipid-A-disaccharide synthase [Thalassotalea castellviae]|uniref:Lipid-A-disaccharide synthase n=1 Tax=Thalassotalea castellviae TaxID=3075612 RepID=A0ABU3A2S3_9GAMM|nr:lipid-A-disaccharide synthase [Thalassotalea sp. W431]MDT0604476.1 lipid-A-disaccharide synthase [Thalassotalea sp. W431]